MSLNQYLQLMFKFSNEIGMKGALNSGDKMSTTTVNVTKLPLVWRRCGMDQIGNE